ncbi:MAG: hypothetical protein WC679_01820 [Bacteroidales bacterium]|jgi:hypothetical protein
MHKSKKLVMIVLAVLTVLTVTGCGRFDRWVAGVTGSASQECIEGISYLQFTSGATVQYDKVTKLPKECK